MSIMHTLDRQLKNMSAKEFDRLANILESEGFEKIGDTMGSVRKEFNSGNPFFNPWHILKIAEAQGLREYGDSHIGMDDIARIVSEIDGITEEQAMLELSEHVDVEFSDAVYERIDSDILDTLRETMEDEAPSLLRGIVRAAAAKAFEKKDFESLKGFVSNGWSGSLVDEKTGVPLEALAEISGSLEKTVETCGKARNASEFIVLLEKLGRDLDAEGDAEEKIPTHRKILGMFETDGSNKHVAQCLGEYAGKLAVLRERDEEWVSGREPSI